MPKTRVEGECPRPDGREWRRAAPPPGSLPGPGLGRAQFAEPGAPSLTPGMAGARRPGELPGSGGLCKGERDPEAVRGWARSANAGRGRAAGPYAVTVMAESPAAAGRAPPSSSAPPGRQTRRRAGASKEARPLAHPRLPCPRPDPRCPATW